MRWLARQRLTRQSLASLRLQAVISAAHMGSGRCGTAGAVAGAAGALEAVLLRTRCALHQSTPDGYCFYESLAVAFGTAGVSLRAVLQGIGPRLQAARGRAAQRAAAEHVAALEAASAARISAEMDEEAAQEEHFRAHFELHAAQWAPQSLAALQAGAERAAAARAAAASRDQVASEDDYAYVSDSD